jgi:hypothetical protein
MFPVTLSSPCDKKAEERKTVLHLEMTEAEKWEGDIQQLSDVLECSDKILSARLEHDLTPEDIPNDTQVCDPHNT